MLNSIKIFLSFVIIAGLFSCDPSHNLDQKNNLNYSELMDNRRFIQVEEVAEALINNDPSISLIDVRSESEFAAFSLPDAKHFSLDKMSAPNLSEKLECDKYKVIFYSNARILSDQAWVISKKWGCQNVYVMEGGINSWFQNILRPYPPGENVSAEELELYNLRMAMRNYFLGLSTELAKESLPRAKVRKLITSKPKKKVPIEEEEGC